jgi:hypothetical protein
MTASATGPHVTPVKLRDWTAWQTETDMSDNLPGNGIFGWLGRQVGYVKKAVKTKPTKAPPAKRSAAQSGPGTPVDTTVPTPPAVLYRQGQVQEAEHPTQPGVKLRRTIIDEVIVEPEDPGQR